MKKLLILAFLALNLTVFSQTDEPEITYNGGGKIITNDGKELQGEISFSFATTNRIFCKIGDADAQKIHTKDVKEFYINDIHFVKVASSALTIGGDNEDIAIFKTPENYKIKIYETIYQKFSGETGGISRYETTRDYVVLFPNETKPKSISNLAFTPFKKVGKYLVDCPALSEKVTNKADGYKLGMISAPDKILEMFLKVAAEYQDCK